MSRQFLTSSGLLVDVRKLALYRTLVKRMPTVRSLRCRCEAGGVSCTAGDTVPSSCWW